jgi:hypothetical protein
MPSMNNPCAVHPDTGQPCPLLHLPKTGDQCRKCRHRVQYVRSIDGHTDTPKYLDDSPAPIFPPVQKQETETCWWSACVRPARSRGLCRTHYRYFHNAKITVWLKDTTLESREKLFRTIMKCANDHKIHWQEAALILLDEGAVQYRKRM